MLPLVVLAALIASGMALSKRDTVAAGPPAAARAAQSPYGDQGMRAAARRAEALAASAAVARRDPVPPRTVYSPLRGKHVPVEDMDLALTPHYRGTAPSAFRDREPARAPEPKRECVEVRGWDAQEPVSLERALNTETAAAASSLSASREGELLMQPVREQRPEPEALARVLPPTIDVLRGGARPRFVDKGRIVPGAAAVPSRQAPVNVPKRTADSFRVQTAADMLPTSAPAERADLRPSQALAATARGLRATNYMTPAGAAAARWKGDTVASTHPGRAGTPELPVGGAARAGARTSGADISSADFANALRDNERDALPHGGTALPVVGVKAAPGATYTSPSRERTDWNLKTVTTSAPRLYGNVRGATAQKQTMHDPNMSARTTIKETLIHDTTLGIAGLRADRVQARSPDAELDPTIRNTLTAVDSNANLAPPVVKPIVYDPDDVHEPTHRDTTGAASRTGNPDTTPEGQGYMTADVAAENTQRQFQHGEYFGIADAEAGDGYTTADVDAPLTQRAVQGDAGADFAPAGSVNSKKSASYAAMYAARMSAIKESVLQGRAPTQVGPQLPRADGPAGECARDPFMEADRRQGNMGRQGAAQTMVQPRCENDTRRVNALRVCNDRHDGFTEIAALARNPYNIDVTRPPAQPLMHRGVPNRA